MRMIALVTGVCSLVIKQLSTAFHKTDLSTCLTCLSSGCSKVALKLSLN
jgi:hypothetical protein